MSEEKKLSYGLDIDLSEFKRDITSIVGEIRSVGSEIGKFAQSVDTNMGKVSQELKQVGQDIKTSLVGALEASQKANEGLIKEVLDAWKQLRTETKSVITDINGLLRSTRTELENVHKSVRQFNMNDWQKQADNYGTAIRKAQGEVKALTQELKKANLEDAQRVEATKRLAEAQKNLSKLQDASKAHVALGVNQDVVKTFDSIQAKIQAINTASRQHSMSDWQKLADNYNTSIGQSRQQVETLKQSLNNVNITQQARVDILKRIAEGEKLIDQLVTQSNTHVQQVKASEEQRLQAVKATTAEIRQAVQDLGLMAGAASAAIFGGLGSAVKEFGNFEEQIIKFGAISNGTAAEIDLVKQKALELGETTKFTAQELGAAAVELSKMGFSAQEVVDSMDAMVEASIASGESLADTSTIIASTLRMFNMQASEAGKVADIITRGANISAQSFGSFADSIRYVGSAASAAGADLQHVSGLLAILADRGIKGTTAGNGLQNAFIRLQAPTKAAREAIAALDLKLKDTMGTASTSDDKLRPMLDIIKEIKATFAARGLNTIEQADFLKDLFGEVSLNTMQVFMNTHNDVMDQVMAKQADYAGSTKETADKMKQGFNYAVEEMKSAFNTLQITVGEDMVGLATKVIKAVQEIIDIFKSLDPVTRQVVEWVTLMSGGIFTAFAGAAGISFVVGKGTDAFKTLASMMTTKVVPAAAETALGIEAVGAAGTTASTGGLAALGATALGLVVAGGAIFLLLQAVKDLNKALDDLDKAADTDVKSRIENLKAEVRVRKALKEGIAPAPADLRPAAASAKERTNQINASINSLKDDYKRWVELGKQIDSAAKSAMSGGAFAPSANQSQDAKVYEQLTKSLKEKLKLKQNEAITENAVTKEVSKLNAALTEQQKKQGELATIAGKNAEQERQAANLNKQKIAGTNGLTEAIKEQVKALDEKLKSQINNNKADKDQAEANIKKKQAASVSHESETINLNANKPGALTSPYGMRIHPIFGTKKMHTGNDYGVPSGTPIQSAASGKIAFSGWAGGYGNTVVVDAGNGTYILYAHNSQLTKKVGDAVKKGEKIALSGSTGNSTGPHSHQEVRKGRSGLTGTAVLGLQTVNPNQTFKGEHDHEADFKIASKQISIESLKKDRSYYIEHRNALNTILAGMTVDQRKNAQELITAISEDNAKIAELNKKLEEDGFDIASITKKEREEQIKSLQQSFKKEMEVLKKGYDDINKLGPLLSRKQDTKSQLQDKAETRGMDAETKDQYLFDKDMKQYAANVENAEKSLQELTNRENELTKEINSQGAASEELQRILDEIIEKREELAAQIANAKEVMPMMIERRSLDKLDEYNKAVSDAQKKYLEMVKGLKQGDPAFETLNKLMSESSVSAEELSSAIGLSTEELTKLGITISDGVSFDEFVNALKLSQDAIEKLGAKTGELDGAEQVDELYQRLGDKYEIFKNIISDDEPMRRLVENIDAGKLTLEQFAKGLELTEEQTKKLETSLNNFRATGFADALDKISFIVNQLGRAIAEIGGEAAESLGVIANGLAGMGQGVGNAIKGAMTGDIASIISGGIQFLTSFVDVATKLVNANKQAVVGFYRALERTDLAKEKSKLGGMERDLQDATAQKDQAKIDKLNSDIRNQKKVVGVKQVLVDFRQEHGDVVLSEKDGIPDFQELQDRYQQKYDEEFAKGKNANKDLLTEYQGYIAAAIDYKDRVAAVMHEAQTEVTKSIEQTVKELTKLEAYNRQQDQNKQFNTDVESMLAGLSGGSEDMKDELRGLAEDIVSERNAIVAEVMEAYGGDIAGANNELAKRLGAFGVEAYKRIGKAVLEAQKKVLEKAQAELEKNADKLKEERKIAYEAEVDSIQALIDKEEDRIDAIERQNAKLQRQIQLKEELNKKDKAAFEKRDTSEFAKKVAAVNYDAEIRAGLDAIHNPDGVQTGTYSGDSRQQAAKERIDLLKLENENKFALEKYDVKDPAKNRAAYIKEKMRIAAIEARFAEEELKTAEVGSRQYIEIMQVQASAYEDYKAAYLESLDNATAIEVAKIQESIEANNKKAESHKARIEEHKTQLDELSKAFEADIKLIDDGVKAAIQTVLDGNEAMIIGAKDLADGVQKPLNKIIGVYNKVAAAARAAISAGAVLPTVQQSPIIIPSSGFIGSKSEPTYGSGGSWGGVAHMATGGVVPEGYPNDTYPALLSSGEAVVPPKMLSEWMGDFMGRVHGQYATNHVSSSNKATIYMDCRGNNNAQQIASEVGRVLERSGMNPNMEAVNGIYYGTLS